MPTLAPNDTSVGASYGILLRGEEDDLAALHALRRLVPALWDAPWEVLAPSPVGPYALTCAGLHEVDARALAEAGVAVLRGSPPELLTGDPLPALTEATPRVAPRLLEALRPHRVPGIPGAEVACFVVPTEAPGARATLSRLLALGRDDTQACEWEEDGTGRLLALVVPRPPLYLLMRAREERHEQIRAYVRAGASPLWVEWGFVHPLQEAAISALQEAGRSALVDGDGRWRYAPPAWEPRSLYDILRPSLDAAEATLHPVEERSKFVIPLRLSAGAEQEPELWLLQPEQFAALEVLIESSSAEDLGALTVSRLTGPEGARYVLREMARPGQTRLGVRVSDIVGQRGFVRAAGTDNLYIPCGRRLVPAVRRDELRALFRLDKSRAVLLDEDRDGPRVSHLTTLPEEPLSRWIEYVAADHRATLDALAETAVFSFLPFEMEQPPIKEVVEAKPPPPPPPPPRITRPVEKAKPQPEASSPKPERAAQIERVDRGDAAKLREEIRQREQLVLAGGATDPALWRDLGELKQLANDRDEASACLEAAIFYGDTSKHLPQQLAVLRAEQLGARQTQEELLDLALKSVLGPTEAAYLYAQILWRVQSGEPLWEEVAQQALKRLGDPELPVSRRLQWATLRAYHLRAEDTLGLTRAKERVLGGLNETGLHESFDLAAFIRFALALEGDSATLGTSREEQSLALDLLWERARVLYVQEFDVLSAYLRLHFATGYARLGAFAKARDLLEPVESEAPVHDAPNRTLFRLYTARITHLATQGNTTSWRQEVEKIKAQGEGSDAVEWLRKQSIWLRSEEPTETNWQAVHVEKLLGKALQDTSNLASALQDAFEVRGVYDFQLAAAVERCLALALKSGNDDLLGNVTEVAIARVGRLGILGHRIQALGACIKGAATLGDDKLVARLLEEVIEIVRSPNVPSVRELLSAARPAVLALRRLGAVEAAVRFLEALEKTSRRSTEGPQLMAALAGGLMQLRQPRAEELLDDALQGALQKQLSYEERFKTASAALEVLPYWSVQSRQRRCQLLLENLGHFRDTFTVSSLYPTYKVLLSEHIIDTLADEITLRTEKIKGFLEQEEQAIRRTIIADWSRACGR